MTLTDKCKEEFEKWMYGENVATLANKDFISKKVYTTTHFYNLPLSMQYGCYLDFFDSVGINLSIFKNKKEHRRGGTIYVYELYINSSVQSPWQSISEARTEAIKKANEIYNKKDE